MSAPLPLCKLTYGLLTVDVLHLLLVFTIAGTSVWSDHNPSRY